MLKLMTRDINVVPGAAQPGRVVYALQTLVAACALASAASFTVACNRIANAPDVHARDFIESLIIQPKISVPHPDGAGEQALKPDTVVPGARAAAEPLATQITVEYLRAKHIQGTKFLFGYRGVQRPAENERLVTIVVTEPKTIPDASDDADHRFLFQVRLRREQQEWRVSGVGTDG